MKLWQKQTEAAPEVETFTIGRDRELDIRLAKYDVLGSIAHATMLQKAGLLTYAESDSLSLELRKIYADIENGSFKISEHTEDIHSQIEFLLTGSLGETGKKIHTGRSRNDQVLLDIKLYTRHEIENIVCIAKELFDVLICKSETYKEYLLPGYTHFQVAMPSSFGLWFGAYAESLVDDLTLLQAAYKMINRNPLGSGAGFGSSLPLDREFTTELLGFDSMNYNAVYAQMTRGKSERVVASALGSIAGTLARLSMDICLYMSQDMGFISFPERLTTGSSIMPHKKNPDVFELIRARCNKIIGLPNELNLMTANLPSGYHRDFQIIKESYLPVFDTIRDSVKMTAFMLREIKVNSRILDHPKYETLFSVEAVNELVNNGVPFREAYKIIAESIENQKFKKPVTNLPVAHSHSGSMGNLSNDKIIAEMEKVLTSFNFEKAVNAEEKLLLRDAL